MVKTSCSPEDYPQFGTLPKEIVAKKAKTLAEWIWGNNQSIPRDRLNWSDSCIIKIIDLVERRRVYFHVYHGIDMSEWNEIALYCFWIVKLQPFFEISSINKIARETNEINAIIAFRMLYSMANRIRCELGRERTKWSNRSNMIHSFRYRDISKESIMALFEVLIEK
jgi:hypothetical protein